MKSTRININKQLKILITVSNFLSQNTSEIFFGSSVPFTKKSWLSIIVGKLLKIISKVIFILVNCVIKFVH